MKDIEYYQHHSLENLKQTSRTLKKGTLNSKSSAGKWRSFQKDVLSLESSQLKSIIKSNYKQAINKLYARKNSPIVSVQELKKLVENVAATINASILQKGLLIRTEEVIKYPYTPLDRLSEAMDQFYEELYMRLQDMPESSDKKNLRQWAMETSAWVEYRINLTDHFFSDGCGKVASALAAFICMRADIYLPSTISKNTQYMDALPKHLRETDNADEDWQFKKWLHFYMTLFEEEDEEKLQFEMTL